jgi:hypothetical protein
MRIHVVRVLSVFLLSGCDLGGGSSAPMEPPPSPEYERAFDEIADIPNQITAQIEWAVEPVDDAIRLADDIAALRTKLDIDDETFTSMCSVAFQDGKIEVGAITMAEDVKLELESVLKRAKEVGENLQTIPARSKAAGKRISRLVQSTPKLVLVASKDLGGELRAAVGDAGVQIEADIDTVKQLPAEIKAEAVAAKDALAELPAKADAATRNLLAAMAGQPYTPLQTTRQASDDELGKSGDKSGDAIASGGDPTNIVDRSAPPEAVVDARVRTLRSLATAMAKYGDWLSAAESLDEASALRPQDPEVAYEAGRAAFRAKDCARAERHLDRFVSLPSSASLVEPLQDTKKMLGEIDAFGCAPRTLEDDAAVAETRKREAEALALEQDFGGVAEKYAAAYQLRPDDHDLAFEVGVAAWKARACSDALVYFLHYVAHADARAARRKIREGESYVARAAAGECQPWSEAEANALARDLHAQAQVLELALDYLAAAGKYERAFALIPSNYVLAYRAAESYWAAGECTAARPYFLRFIGTATDERHADERARAKAIVTHIDTKGCGAH